MQQLLRFFVIAITAGISVPLAAHAQEAAPLPSATEIIARYVKASHMDLIATHSSSRSTAKLEVSPVGLTGSVVELRGKPDMVVSITTLAGRGESRSGFDGERGWSIDPANGPKLMTTEDTKDARISANFLLSLRDTTLFRTRETVEIAEFGGQKCYRVKLVAVSGRESFECFSMDTGLLVAAQRKANSPLGVVDNVSLYSDYKNFGGIMLASKIVSEVAGIKRTLTLESVVFDDAKPTDFDLPPQVKALIKP